MSIPANEMTLLLQSGQAIMTPETAALAAESGVPFAFAATPNATQDFTAALAADGGSIAPATPQGLSSAQSQQQSNTIFNQFLANAGGAAAEQAAGISTPSTTAPANTGTSFSWLDPFPWLKSEGLNILLIVIGVITIIIVITALFRAANNSAPVRYTRENSKAALGAAKTVKESLLTETAEVAAVA